MITSDNSYDDLRQRLAEIFFQEKTSTSEEYYYICTSYVDKFVLIATTGKNAKPLTIPFLQSTNLYICCLTINLNLR